MGSTNNRVTSRTWTGNGADRKVTLGYRPKQVTIHNVTDRISYDKMDRMIDDKSLKSIATGVSTYVDSVRMESDGFTILAAENVDTKEFHYSAHEGNND